LLNWGPFRAWIGSRLKPSGKCRDNDVYIAFEDKGGGGDVYDVTVRFPVPPDTSVSQAAGKFPQGRFRVRYNNRNCMMVRINADVYDIQFRLSGRSVIWEPKDDDDGRVSRIEEGVYLVRSENGVVEEWRETDGSFSVKRWPDDGARTSKQPPAATRISEALIGPMERGDPGVLSAAEVSGIPQGWHRVRNKNKKIRPVFIEGNSYDVAFVIQPGPKFYLPAEDEDGLISSAGDGRLSYIEKNGAVEEWRKSGKDYAFTRWRTDAERKAKKAPLNTGTIDRIDVVRPVKLKPTVAGISPAGTPLNTSGLPVVCGKLVSKRKPVGLNAWAVTFDAPPGNGRRGANGFLIDAPAGWEKQV